MKFCPKFGPHILVSNVGAVETERRKNPHDIKQHHFFVFGNCGLLNFPWEWYIQHISTWNSKANQVFFSMVVPVGWWTKSLFNKWLFHHCHPLKNGGLGFQASIYHTFTIFKSTIHGSIQKKGERPSPKGNLPPWIRIWRAFHGIRPQQIGQLGKTDKVPGTKRLSIWVFPKIGVAQNGWFMMGKPY